MRESIFNKSYVSSLYQAHLAQVDEENQWVDNQTFRRRRLSFVLHMSGVVTMSLMVLPIQVTLCYSCVVLCSFSENYPAPFSNPKFYSKFSISCFLLPSLISLLYYNCNISFCFNASSDLCWPYQRKFNFKNHIINTLKEMTFEMCFSLNC